MEQDIWAPGHLGTAVWEPDVWATSHDTADTRVRKLCVRLENLPD